jgi:hypothetical protein
MEMTRLGLTRQVRRRGKTETATPRLNRIVLTNFGLTAEVNLTPYGLPVGDLARHQERLESAMVADCKVRKVGHGQARVEFRHTDPLASTVPVETLPPPRRPLHVVTRVDEDGRPVEQDVTLPLLVIGGQGAGKSTEIDAYFHQLQQAGIPHRARFFDPKGGMQLGAFQDAAHEYESRPTGWPKFLGNALAALSTRQRSMAGRDWQKLYKFTERDPLEILVIDELLAVIGQRAETVRLGRTGSMRADDALDLYLSQGRAAGFSVIALSQLGQKEILGRARALFPHLTVLRMPPSEEEIVTRLLGPGHPAHLIPPGPRYAGVGYTRTPEGRVVRCRGALLTPEQRMRVVARMAADTERRAPRTARKSQDSPEPAGVG